MSTHPLGNRDLIRAINRSAVLNTIKTYGPIARTEIARQTGLSAATISGITAELLDNDLIFEKAAGHSRGGRRPILLAINPRKGFVVGLKLAETFVVGALTDLEANVIAKETQSLNGRSYTKAIDALVSVVNLLVQQQKVRRKQLLGVGVGLAGTVDNEKGILRYSPIFGWRDVPIGELLQNRVQVPVHIDNDVNTLTLTEKWFGAGQGVNNFLTVTIGRGIGLGIVVNGQIYRGRRGGAGELGHSVIDPNGPLCACGNRGCLEAYVADPSLLRMATEAVEQGNLPGTVETLEDLLALAHEGHEAACAIYAKAGRVLGLGIANLINLFNPQQVLISGEGVRAGELLFSPMREAIAHNTMPSLVEDTRIQVDVWKDDAWARGAASLVLGELFKSPVQKNGKVKITV